MATRSERARAAIEDGIMSGRYPPGGVIDERALAAELGISRTPVREAIMQLSAGGLIECRPRQSAIVRTLEPAQVAELFEALGGLETLVAELAARRITAAELAELDAVIARSAKAVAGRDFDAYAGHNLQFHDVLHRACRNGWLAGQAREMRQRVAFYRQWLFAKVDRLDRSQREHEEILHAVRARDEALARRLMREHERIDADQLMDFMLAHRAPAGASAAG